MRIGYVVPGLLAALTAGAVLSGGCKSSGDGDGTPPPSVVGKVDNEKPVVTLDEAEAWPGTQIPAGSIIETNEDGWVVFRTVDVASCKALKNSRLQIRPDESLAIKWLGTSGITYCNKKSGQAQQQFGINGKITITMTDPIFGVVLGEQESLVRLIDGSAIVTVEGQEARIEVGPGQELLVRSDGTTVLRRLTPLSEEELEIVRELGGTPVTPTDGENTEKTPEAPADTPKPTGTACPTLEVARFWATQATEGAEVRWVSLGGCPPVQGTLTARVSSKDTPYDQWTVTVQEGSQLTDLPCEVEGKYSIDYKIELTDDSGQTASRTTNYTYNCVR